MTIRLAASADVEVLTMLEAACFAPAWSLHTLSAALADEKYIVLLAQDANDNCLGYALGWSVGDEAEVARIGVLSEFRKNGWGEQLTRTLLEAFATRGVRVVYLEVRTSNEGAQRMYARCGFRVVGQRNAYYDDNETAVVMAFDRSEREQVTTL